MSYGSSSYGAAVIGGASASQWQVFFVYTFRATGSHQATAQFSGSGTFYSLFARQSNENIPLAGAVYTANDPNETPQLQTTFGGVGQSVIGTARFITVIITLPVAGETFSIMGRPGD